MQFSKETCSPRCHRQGFSLIELLVSLSILTLIVLALYSLFDTTQKALRANITQVDVLESGRAAVDLITRRIEQIEPTHITNTYNLRAQLHKYPTKVVTQSYVESSSGPRTNFLQEVFFMDRVQQNWVAHGFRVINATNGVGTLAQMTLTTNLTAIRPRNMWDRFSRTPDVFMQRIVEGVIHFRVVPFDSNGWPFRFDRVNRKIPFRKDPNQIEYWLPAPDRIAGQPASNLPRVPGTGNVLLSKDPHKDGHNQTSYIFRGNALPAYLELELGILEPDVLEAYKSFVNFKMARDFLSKQVGKVHLFRQRIPIRSALR